jgi:hypothetical protein
LGKIGNLGNLVKHGEHREAIGNQGNLGKYKELWEKIGITRKPWETYRELGEQVDSQLLLKTGVNQIEPYKKPYNIHIGTWLAVVGKWYNTQLRILRSLVLIQHRLVPGKNSKYFL